MKKYIEKSSYFKVEILKNENSAIVLKSLPVLKYAKPFSKENFVDVIHLLGGIDVGIYIDETANAMKQHRLHLFILSGKLFEHGFDKRTPARV